METNGAGRAQKLITSNKEISRDPKGFLSNVGQGSASICLERGGAG